MPIIRFSDEYEALAELHGKSAQSLRDRDAGRDVYRLACTTPEGRMVGSLTEYHGPDDRRFMRHVGDERAALVTFAQAELQAPVYVNVPNEAVATWEALGFGVEVAQEAFRLRFDAVLRGLAERRFRQISRCTPRMAWTRSGFSCSTITWKRYAGIRWVAWRSSDAS